MSAAKSSQGEAAPRRRATAAPKAVREGSAPQSAQGGTETCAAPPKARGGRSAAQRRTRLLEALETRLEALTEALMGAQLAEKGIDMMKEIKELHSMLEALHQENGARPKGGDAPRVTVVWGGGAACGTAPETDAKKDAKRPEDAEDARGIPPHGF